MPAAESPRKTSNCRSCGAEIVWAVTATGKRMPLDAKPEKRVVLEPRDVFGEIAEVKDTFVSHFATCPDADQHRRREGA